MKDPILFPGLMPVECLQKMPPTIVTTGEFDFMRKDALAIIEKLRKAGRLLDVLDMPGASHAQEQKVNDALDEIRPFLREDGGDLNVVEITGDRILRIEFTGTCSSCSMNNMTFKNGVEDAIKRLVPEIVSVEPVNFHLTEN